jgi:hypothetical protein
MIVSISNGHRVIERKYRRKLLLFLLFSVFAFLSLASSTVSLSAKLDGHPQVRAQVGALARTMLRDISQSVAEDEEADYSSGPDTDQPPFAAAPSALLPAVNLLISLETHLLAASSLRPLRSTPRAPRAPPSLL